MAFEIKKPEDIIHVKIMKVLIYGPPGVRKTSYAFTAKDVLLLDFQQGVRRVEGKYRGEYAIINSWPDALEIFSQDLTKYSTIALDPVGNMLDMISYHIMQKNQKLRRPDGALSLQGFGVLANQFKEFMQRIEQMGKHIVLIAHDKEVKVKDDIVYRPDITGQSLGNVTREVDLVGYIKSNGGNSTISFDPSDEYYGKNSCRLPKTINTSEMTLEAIIDTGLDTINSGSLQYQQYMEQLKKIGTIFDNCHNADELNDAFPFVFEMEFVSDAKEQAKIMLASRSRELDLKVNKKTKKYEPKTEVQDQHTNA